MVKKRKISDLTVENRCDPLLKKSHLSNEDKCNEIEWLVEVLGVDEFLYEYMAPSDIITILGDDNKLAKCYAPNGLIFDGSHWILKKNGKEIDSYERDHQIRGTAHFCQTFALMYYLGLDKKLVKGDGVKNNYAKNIRLAVNFWQREFKTRTGFAARFMKNARQYWGDPRREYYSQVLGKFTGKLTVKDLYILLEWVREEADSLVNCKQS